MKKIDIACIVDDDPIYVLATKKVMDIAGFSNSIMVFTNGKIALDSLHAIIKEKAQMPDVILLDLNMPVMDGWEFLDEFIKIEQSNKTTIFIVSSSINPEDITRAKTYENVKNYIIKPITDKALEKIMKEMRA